MRRVTIAGLTIATLIGAIGFTAPPADLPKVELDFNHMAAGDWEGKRLNQIVPADTIKRVVRWAEHGFARDPSREAAYDALLAHLLDSAETARGWALGGNEGRLADLMVVTKGGDLLRIEVVGTLDTRPSPTAILIHGKGRGARIDVKGFRPPRT